jgi:predicted phosphoribosyltransferase
VSFDDRTDAGRRLAAALASYRKDHPLILALPRGGVPVAAEVARALDAPLELLIVRKIGVPDQRELAMGAVVDANPPIVVRNEDVIASAGIEDWQFDRVRDEEIAEIGRRRRAYLGNRPHLHLAGRTVIVVDDGIATGATMRAALRGVRTLKPKRVVLAVPVAAPSSLEDLGGDADDIVCLEPQEMLGAIGYYYADFAQVRDDEVIAALKASSDRA